MIGLFRRPPQNNEAYPVIGVLPVGRENTFGENLFNFTKSSELQRAHGLADASLSIVHGKIVPTDVMKIELIDEESQVKAKPVYALTSFEWSAFMDAFNQRDRYWYFGSLRDYVTFALNAYSDSITWNCAATITYTEPCSGCSNCYREQNKLDTKPTNRRWWSGFIPSFRLGSSQSGPKVPDFSKLQNTQCTVKTNMESNSAGIVVNSSNIQSTKSDETIPRLSLKLIKGNNGFGFISDSWDRLDKNNINLDCEHSIRTVEIQPNPNTNPNPDQEKFFYIDREAYEVKSIRITLLPKLINFFSL